MRILIISKFFPPENSIASLRPYSWAKYWAEAGHEIDVLTTVKDLNRPEVSGMPTVGFKVHEIDFPTAYYRLKTLFKGQGSGGETANAGELNSTKQFSQGSSLSKPNLLKRVGGKANEFRIRKGLMLSIRMPDTLDFWVSGAVHWARRQSPWDLVVSTHGPYATHLVAYRLKRENLVRKWVADYRDLWTDNHIYKGVFPFTVAENYLERKSMRLADFITTVSEPLAHTLGKKHGSEKVFVVENGFESDILDKLPSEPAFPIDGKKRIMYAGTIYKGRRDPSPLFAAMAALAMEPGGQELLNRLEVIFLGSNPSVLQEVIDQYQVGKWVTIGGFLPRLEILRMQRDANALLFLETEGIKNEGILTGKLFEYLNSKTQIWGVGIGNHSSPGELILKARAGLLFEKDETLLLQELKAFLSEEQKRVVRPDASFLKKFDRKALAIQMLSHLEDR